MLPLSLLAVRYCCVGDLNKLVLEFERVFWCDEDMFGCVREDAALRGRLYMFWNVHRINGAAILVCLLSGDSAREVEALEDERLLVEEAMQLLRRMFGADAPNPVRSLLTRWASDPLARGSYSFVAVGATAQGTHSPTQPRERQQRSDRHPACCSLLRVRAVVRCGVRMLVCVWCVVCGAEYVSLSLPVGRCHFAGEACNRYYPATVHGAILSGYWAAGHIHNSFHASHSRPHTTRTLRVAGCCQAR